ncbi:MAG: MGMT family protein [Deltaproteobacteria bacterium]|nr:MAG: MGMT family protein [Deltaproteobacteria bacterium]
MTQRIVPAGALHFDTALGPVLLAYGPKGVKELHLPDPGPAPRRSGAHLAGAAAGGASASAETGVRLPRLGSTRLVPTWVRTLVRRIQGHLEGAYDHFDDVPLDLPDRATAFEREIWAAAREVPPGATITYGELARAAGYPGAARACGRAMKRCPVALIIPAHRVVAAGGRIGGWTGPGGIATKRRLLEIEGVSLPP